MGAPYADRPKVKSPIAPSPTADPPTQNGPFYSLAYKLPDGTAVYQDGSGNLFTNDDMGPDGQAPRGNWKPYAGERPSGPTIATPPGAPPAPAGTVGPGAGPAPSAGAGGSGGGGGGYGGPSGDFVPPPRGWDRNTWESQLPTFNAPGYTPPPAYAPGQFVEPDYAAALNDPGYQFEMNQGTGALQASAAARGVLNGGGTLKDINAWGQNYASTRVNDVRTRARDTYQLNEGARQSAYNTNYQTQYADPYKYAYQSALDAFTNNLSAWQTKGSVGQRQNEIDWQQSYTPWNDQWNRRITVGLS